MQTSDPDLVIKLSEEEPADPSVITAAQGQLSAEDNRSFVSTKHICAWVWGGGCERRLRDPFSTLYDPRKRMLGRTEYYGSPKPVSAAI